jgi:hypothetical protein
MKSIIEKLYIKELMTIPCSHVKPSEACDYTAVKHGPLKERERLFRELIDAIIECRDELAEIYGKLGHSTVDRATELIEEVINGH